MMTSDAAVRGGRRAAYPAYKPSAVEWLGHVPEHWEVRRLKYSVELVNQKVDGSEAELPYTGLEHIESWTGRLIAPNGETSSDGQASLFRRGDVLFGKLRPYLAKAHAADTDGICTGELLVFRPRAVSQTFLRDYLLNPAFTAIVDSSTYGAKMPRASWDFIGNLPVLIPPTREQQAIVAFLDRETERIDALIEKKRRQTGLLQEKRAALISHAVTKGLNPDAPMKDSGIEWLGHIPAHWQVLPIRYLAAPGYKMFTDGDWVESPYIRHQGIRLIQTGNIGVGAYIEQGFRYIDETAFQELNCTEVMPGDVLICRLAEPVGRACLAPDFGTRMITSVDVCILKPRQNVDARFVVHGLSGSTYLAWMNAACRGGTRDRVSRSMLGAVRIQVPPLREQRGIAAYLDSETARIDALVDRIENSVGLLSEYRTALISAAVTGKIDVRVEVGL